MALNATQIVDGINVAQFTDVEWNQAMVILKLQVELGLKQAEIRNLHTWLDAKTVHFDEVMTALNIEAAALAEEINALAPTQ